MARGERREGRLAAYCPLSRAAVPRGRDSRECCALRMRIFRGEEEGSPFDILLFRLLSCPGRVSRRHGKVGVGKVFYNPSHSNNPILVRTGTHKYTYCTQHNDNGNSCKCRFLIRPLNPRRPSIILNARMHPSVPRHLIKQSSAGCVGTDGSGSGRSSKVVTVVVIVVAGVLQWRWRVGPTTSSSCAAQRFAGRSARGGG